MQEITNIMTAFDKFDIKSKAFILSLYKEKFYGKNLKKLCEVQIDRYSFKTLRKQKDL